MIALDDNDSEIVADYVIMIASYLESALMVTGCVQSISCFKDGVKMKKETKVQDVDAEIKDIRHKRLARSFSSTG